MDIVLSFTKLEDTHTHTHKHTHTHTHTLVSSRSQRCTNESRSWME